MPIRKDVLSYLDSQPNRSVPVSNKGRRTAEFTLAESIKDNNEARREVLLERLAQYYGVVFFGSARFGPSDPETQIAHQVAGRVAVERGMDIVTGGGPGIMDAANRGAKELLSLTQTSRKNKGTKTHGSRIELPFEEKTNPFLDVVTTHAEFPARIQEMIDKSHSAYVGIGGFGTLLEISMLLQQRQVDHLPQDYAIFIDPWWKGIFLPMYDKMYHERRHAGQTPLIDEKDL